VRVASATGDSVGESVAAQPHKEASRKGSINKKRYVGFCRILYSPQWIWLISFMNVLCRYAVMIEHSGFVGLSTGEVECFMKKR